MPVIVVAQDEWSPKPEVAQDRFYCIEVFRELALNYQLIGCGVIPMLSLTEGEVYLGVSDRPGGAHGRNVPPFRVN